MADLDMTVVRMRHLTDSTHIVGEAVLKSFPLRLWQRHQQHMDAVLREFHLVLGGAESQRNPTVPQHLVDVAGMFTVLFATLVEALSRQRVNAVADGLDRIDARVQLFDRTPDLLDYLGVVLKAVDTYCTDGDLLTLARPPEMIALADWIMSELAGQYFGAAPTSWSGPF